MTKLIAAVPPASGKRTDLIMTCLPLSVASIILHSMKYVNEKNEVYLKIFDEGGIEELRN